MTESIEPAIDDAAYASLEDIADGDTEFMMDLVEQYVMAAQTLIDSLLAAAEVADAGEVERSAHTLKSASDNVGAKLLSGICEALQNCGRAGQLDDVLERSREAEAEFQRVREELQNRLVKLAG
jgi:HPt (histidine-containing phosphotransfer) domain-containing protein